MAKKNALQIHQMTFADFERLFRNEEACKDYLVANRWPDGIRCPRCGNHDVREATGRSYNWICYQCSPDGVGYRFSVLVGTIFENTNKPLRDWFRVMHLMLTSKKGISSLQICRMMGFGSYNTALLMTNKIRAALGGVEFKKLIGCVEVDETFVGGKAKNKHKGPGGRGDFGGTGGKGKAVIAGAVRRKGNVVARVVANTSQEVLEAFVRYAVSERVSLVSTDEHRGYGGLRPHYPHGVVQHGAGQYVHGNIHTNTIEGFWSIVKRGIIGTFRKVSQKHLPLYVNEFEFRYNNRRNADIFQTAIRAC